MPIGQFLGGSFPKLRLGSIITGPFEQISNFFPESAAVPFGALLKYGSSKKKYDVTDGSETDASVFAGIAAGEIAAASSTYPGTKTQYEIAEPGNVLIQGAIAVGLSSATGTDVDDAVEGAKVYLADDGLVTTAADNGLASPDDVAYLLLPNLIFTGDTETVDGVTLVGVRKLY